MDSYDLLIVGGGIGGSALATVMARSGKSVLLLEKSEAYEDKVRGEWLASWGVAEAKRLGLYDILMAAGGHHVTRHVSYDESLDPKAAEAFAIPLGAFAQGVPGPLCLRHPIHCQALFDAAKAASAEALRGVNVLEVAAGYSSARPATRASGPSPRPSWPARKRCRRRSLARPFAPVCWRVERAPREN